MAQNPSIRKLPPDLPPSFPLLRQPLLPSLTVSPTAQTQAIAQTSRPRHLPPVEASSLRPLLLPTSLALFPPHIPLPPVQKKTSSAPDLHPPRSLTHNPSSAPATSSSSSSPPPARPSPSDLPPIPHLEALLPVLHHRPPTLVLLAQLGVSLLVFEHPECSAPCFRCLLSSHHRRSATQGRTRSPAPSGINRCPLPGSSPVRPSASLPAPLFHKAGSPRLASVDAISGSSARRSPLSGPP